ncbi:daunorubicin ABC transporter ATP-binding protein [Candidatus Bathyarchaeota archaeon ex4484_231]|nr:MAG: daunorubicin ABC transporter ATP-binding protein [Candidatus Bathyarchaeota archaeon ex4484_231]
MLSVRNLTKKFSDKTVLHNVSFEVKNEVFGLLGPNGAGKTTLLRIIAGIIKPTKGEVRILGVESYKDKARESIGYCPQESVVYNELTGMENLMFYAGLYGLRSSKAKRRAKELLSLVELSDYADRRVKVYSGGMRKRLNFAIALIGYPKILLLDEPTVGMDPHIRKAMWDLILRFRDEGKCIILATHHMEEADILSDRVAIIDAGEIRAEGNPEDLKRTYGPKSVINLELFEAGRDLHEILKCYASNEGVIIKENYVRVHVDNPERSAPKIISSLMSHGCKLRLLRIEAPTLEDVFLRLTGRRLSE